MKKKYTKKQRQVIALSRSVSILLYGCIMTVIFIVGLAFFARPAQSALEKRDLTQFPSFSMTSFLDGSYFNQITTWYADTYPGREVLMNMSSSMEGMYGIQTGTRVFGGGTGDTIPDTSETVNIRHEQTEPPATSEMADEIQNRIMAGLLVQDGAAYAGYYFINEVAPYYADIVNRTAEYLKGTTNVYNILIPNNSGVMLDEKTLEKLGGTDQKQAIDYHYGLMSEDVHTINTIDTLREHNQEYLYYRTDHHWTPLGAYYIYCNFCEEKGFEPANLEDLESQTFEPFYGSYYLELKDDSLQADVVTGYIPKTTNEIRVYYDSAAERVPLSLDLNNWTGMIFDYVSVEDEYNQYMRFINGDQPITVMDNPEIEDGTTCVVVKESYGNVFVPFLVDHYDKVIVLDCRRVDASITEFCKENQVTDLIIMNNISILNVGLMNLYDYLFEPAQLEADTVKTTVEDSSDTNNQAG